MFNVTLSWKKNNPLPTATSPDYPRDERLSWIGKPNPPTAIQSSPFNHYQKKDIAAANTRFITLVITLIKL